MNRYRKTAIIAGVLFITATVASLLSAPFLAPMNEPHYLVSVAANANQVTFGALLAFVAAAASASIAIALYPLLRKYQEGLALGAVGFRLIEGVFYMVEAMCLLVLVAVGQELCQSWSCECLVLSSCRCRGRSRISWGRQCVAAGFLPGCSDVLCHLLSNTTRSSMVIRLGSCGSHLVSGSRPVGHVRSHRTFVDAPGRFGSSHRRARDGARALADRERLQVICHCFNVCQKRSPTSAYSRLDATRRSYALGARPD